MRANRFRAGGQQIFLDRVITSFDGRTRAEGFHILHDWDGVVAAVQSRHHPGRRAALSRRPARRGSGERDRARHPARLLLHARPGAADDAHLGRWRSGREPRSRQRAARRAAGTERQRPAVRRRRRDADADRHVALRAGRVGLRQAARESAHARRASPVPDRPRPRVEHGLPLALRLRGAVRPRHAGAARRQRRRLSVAVLCARRGDAGILARLPAPASRIATGR